MNCMKVLLVEDDLDLIAQVLHRFGPEGIVAEHVSSAGDARIALRDPSFTVAVLDVRLGAGPDGLTLCRELRDAGVGIPILMLTALDAIADRVAGLAAGADDYLSKPFAFDELVARIRALGRRHLPHRSGVLRHGSVELDTQTQQARAADGPVELTVKETALLELLLSSPTVPHSREAISQSLWTYEDSPASNLVEVYVLRLRRKLAAAGSPEAVETIRGRGYRLRTA
jgi:DNA-binding response OmpR family regulator